jgi:hypothetical protein
MVYKVLNKSKNFYPTPNNVIWTILISCFVIEIIKHFFFGWDENSFNVFDGILFFILFLSITSGFIIPLIKRNKYETLQGELSGNLEFLANKIIINETDYYISDITKIQILGGIDYKGRESMFNIQGNFDCYRSNGTDNTLILFLNEKQIKINFLQEFKNQIINDKDIFINYCNLGKLNYLNLLDILQINDYQKIQTFKKMYLKEFQ